MSPNVKENKLKKILAEFSQAVKWYQKNAPGKADEIFTRMAENYQDLEDDSVQEILIKAKSYQAIVQSKLNPVDIKLESDEDYINEGVFLLNSGNYDKSLEVLNQADKKTPKNPYIFYLMSMVYLKNDDRDKSLEYLGKAIELDEYYKILAYNESDFKPISEEEEFISLVEIEDE